MKPVAISVVIPTRNRPQLLRDALTSAAGQSLPPAEILIGDDSDDSIDNAGVIADVRTRSEDVSMIHLRERAGNQAANVQRLFESATCKWVCLLHDDDMLLPSALRLLSDAIVAFRSERGQEPVLAYGRQIVIDD